MVSFRFSKLVTLTLIAASYKLYGKLKHKRTNTSPRSSSAGDNSEIKENVDNVWGDHVSLWVIMSDSRIWHVHLCVVLSFLSQIWMKATMACEGISARELLRIDWCLFKNDHSWTFLGSWQNRAFWFSIVTRGSSYIHACNFESIHHWSKNNSDLKSAYLVVVGDEKTASAVPFLWQSRSRISPVNINRIIENIFLTAEQPDFRGAANETERVCFRNKLFRC